MEDLLLLHGAIGAKDQFDLLSEVLAPTFNVHRINFSGHGGSSMPAIFSIEIFANDVLHYMNEQNIPTIDIFGYSMGGYVALYLAKHHPEKVKSIFTFATKFSWTPEIAHHEIKMLDAKKISEKIPAFAQQLAKRHGMHWETVLEKTATMMIGLGNGNPLHEDDYKSIAKKTLIGIGDKDNMVALDETVAVYKNLPNASLIVFPDTLHPFEKINIARLQHEIEWFFCEGKSINHTSFV